MIAGEGGPTGETLDRGMLRLFAGALVVEAVVLVTLWIAGRYFGG